MVLAIKSEPLPLKQEPDGTVRVGGTRVLLDVVVGAFRDGASAEHIVEQYPALDLADVYATIAYYLNNQAEVDAYLEARQSEADRLRAEIESHIDTRGLRERLLARRKAKQQGQQP
jgi:uncharacterized protein (DUF433 family)